MNMDAMAEQISGMDKVITSMNEIQADTTVPRNIRIRIESIITSLKDNAELQIKVNKALNELDEISNDSNLESYTRTQVWNVMSALEKCRFA